MPDYSKLLFLALMLFSSASGLAADGGPAKIEIDKQETGYRLLRNGVPFEIRGAGLENGNIPLFADHGGNAIRNWSTENAQEVLDIALENGVMVALGLPVLPERWGFDYNDENAVALQLENIRQEVIRYRNHPALLGWIIGNELNFDYQNSRVYDAVNDISMLIHELDPNHPTTTTVAGLGLNVVKDLQERATDLDILSFQVYGELANVPEFLEQANLNRPVWITEWGAIGHWEMAKTSWQAPIEMNSSEKAAVYLDGYEEKIRPYQDSIIGSFAFLWGQKQERTPTWFGMFTEAGHETETVDIMHRLWTGEWPENRSPALISFTIAGKNATDDVILAAGSRVDVAVDVTDPDGDALRLQWELKPESDAQEVGGDREATMVNLALTMEPAASPRAVFQVPESPGAYRLFVYAYDGNNHAAHANIPFLVQ